MQKQTNTTRRLRYSRSKTRYTQKAAALIADMFGIKALGNKAPKHGFLSTKATLKRKHKRNAARRRKAITKTRRKALVRSGKHHR